MGKMSWEKPNSSKKLSLSTQTSPPKKIERINYGNKTKQYPVCKKVTITFVKDRSHKRRIKTKNKISNLFMN